MLKSKYFKWKMWNQYFRNSCFQVKKNKISKIQPQNFEFEKLKKLRVNKFGNVNQKLKSKVKKSKN